MFTYLILASVLAGMVRGQVWEKWKPDWIGPRDDLLCDHRCKAEAEKDATDRNKTYDKCCACHSQTTWERDNSLIGLDMEYITAEGGSLAYLQDKHIRNDSRKQIIFRDGVMTSLPTNLCNILNLMVINFSYNKIRRLSGIECAVSLDTVNLEGNRIAYVSNNSFVELTLLRNLNLANNIISRLEPGTLFHPNLKMFDVDFSNNDLTQIDITNAISSHMYCTIDYADNKVSEFTNEINFQIDFDRSYGPGFTSFENNNFVKFPNFQQLLNLDSLSQIGKLFEFGFDFRGVPLICDCNIEHFLSLGLDGDLVDAVWRKYFNVTCAGPQKYKDVPVVQVPLQDLICNLSAEDNCPVECSCKDQPYHNTIKIDCVHALLTSLPENLPTSYFSDKIDLDVSGNSITEIPENLPYLERIETLDISNNSLKHISEEVAAKLENASSIIVADNPLLKSLPQGFQFRNACSVELGEQIIDCNCDSLWIAQWMDVKGCQDKRNDVGNITDITTVAPSDSSSNSISDSPTHAYTTAAVSEMSTSGIDATMPVTTTVSVDSNSTINYIQNSTDTDRVHFFCNVPDVGVIKATEFRSEMLACDPDPNTWILIVTYSLVSALTLLIIVASLVYMFRYELLVLFVRGVFQNMHNNILTSNIVYDAFVSFDEDNDDLRKWMETFLIPHLQVVGYKLFIPYLHMDYGGVRDNLTIAAMKKSRNMLLVMSESYLEPKEERPLTENEWKYGWNNFAFNRNTPIVIINYDHVTADMVDDPRIKAHLRVGKVIDFTNRSRDIMPRVELALGKLGRPQDGDGLRNAAPTDVVFYDDLPEVNDKIQPRHLDPATVMWLDKEADLRTDTLPVDDEASEEQFEPHVDTTSDEIEPEIHGTPSNDFRKVNVINVEPMSSPQETNRVEDVPGESNVQSLERNVENKAVEMKRNEGKSSYQPSDHETTKKQKGIQGGTITQNNRSKRSAISSEPGQSRQRENTVLYSRTFKRLYGPDGLMSNTFV